MVKTTDSGVKYVSLLLTITPAHSFVWVLFNLKTILMLEFLDFKYLTVI